MEHKYSTMALMIILGVLGVATLGVAITNQTLRYNPTSNYLCISGGNCSDLSDLQDSVSGGGNPFNQTLNSTSKVEFNALNVSGGNLNIRTDRGIGAIRLLPNDSNGYSQIQFYPEGKFNRITNSNPAYSYPEGDVLINVHKTQEDSANVHRHLSIYSTNSSNISIKRLDMGYMEDWTEFIFQNSDIRIGRGGQLEVDKIVASDMRTNETNIIMVPSDTNKDVFMNFRRSGNNPQGYSGIMFSMLSASHFFLYGDGDTLRLRYKDDSSEISNVSKAFDYLVINTTAGTANFETSFFIDDNILYVNDSNDAVGINRYPSASFDLDIGAVSTGKVRVAQIYGFTDLNMTSGNKAMSIALDDSEDNIEIIGGNVGIGTATANKPLVVVGQSNFTGDMFVDSNVIYINTSKNTVGINRASFSLTPYDLEVGASGAGDMRIAMIDGFSDLNLSTASGTAWIRLDSSGGDIQIKGKLNQTSGETYLGGIKSDGTGKVVCIKSDGALGTCSTIVDVTGACTCG